MADTQEDYIEKFIHEYREKRERLAHAKARCRRSENAKKRIIALAMKSAANKGHKSAAAQLREAEASEHYERWEDEDVDALLERELIQGDIDADELRWESWRTRRADRRAEINLR